MTEAPTFLHLVTKARNLTMTLNPHRQTQQNLRRERERKAAADHLEIPLFPPEFQTQVSTMQHLEAPEKRHGESLFDTERAVSSHQPSKPGEPQGVASSTNTANHSTLSNTLGLTQFFPWFPSCLCKLNQTEAIHTKWLVLLRTLAGLDTWRFEVFNIVGIFIKTKNLDFSS